MLIEITGVFNRNITRVLLSPYITREICVIIITSYIAIINANIDNTVPRRAGFFVNKGIMRLNVFRWNTYLYFCDLCQRLLSSFRRYGPTY